MNASPAVPTTAAAIRSCAGSHRELHDCTHDGCRRRSEEYARENPGESSRTVAKAIDSHEVVDQRLLMTSTTRASSAG